MLWLYRLLSRVTPNDASSAGAHETIAVGAPAPDFALPADDGTTVRLSDLRGKPVVLFFYPKDDTPTCTVEACSFRDAHARLASLGAVVLGISTDDVRSHQRFRAKQRLPYPLLADVDHAVASAYGVWREKTLFGHRFMGVVRTTFVVDREGRVARVFAKVRSDRHGDAVADALSVLG